MNEELMTETLYQSDVEEGTINSRACKTISLELGDVRVKCSDRGKWRDFVNHATVEAKVWSTIKHTFETK